MAAAKDGTGMIGELLGARYRIDAEVGAGGMATVYRAYDTTLERDVAVKLMHREVAGDEQQLERFRREARAAAKLAHAHIVTVVDAGEENNRPYIVFEFVEGETLKQRIKRLGKLPVTEAVAYAIEIGSALAAAHAGNIVHRDVKPQNVLLDREGHAKVADFGIARELETDGLTKTGRVLGTTDYVSPEQAMGETVTGCSDIYSLGIVLFEMLSGEPPFKGDNHVAVAMKHVKETLPDIRTLRPEVSSALAAVLEKMTAKDPHKRIQSAAEAVAELEDTLAVEVSRSGHVSGEATTVLDALPRRSRRFVPDRLRHRTRSTVVRVSVALVFAAVVTAVVFNLESGTGNRPRIGNGSTGTVIPIVATGAFDPQGDNAEHDGQTGEVRDGNAQTSWTTESYQNGILPPNKAGVGIYVKTVRPATAKSIKIQTPQKSLSVEIYGAKTVPQSLAGWTRLGAASGNFNSRAIALTPADGLRYFMVWITQLPQASQSRARISEIELLR